MSINPLTEAAQELGQKIANADQNRRLALQPQFHRALTRLRNDGYQVPRRLRELDLALTDELIEAQFDNMPV